MFDSLPLVADIALFAAAAAAVWMAGIKLSDSTDVLSSRLNLGKALGGLILLAVATNLPEIAITVTAAASGAVGIATGNILGGIAIQTVVLVALDAFGTRGGRPLSYRGASLILVLPSDIYLTGLGILLTAVYLVGLILRPKRRIAGMGLDSLLVLILYAVGVIGLVAIHA